MRTGASWQRRPALPYVGALQVDKLPHKYNQEGMARCRAQHFEQRVAHLSRPSNRVSRSEHTVYRRTWGLLTEISHCNCGSQQ